MEFFEVRGSSLACSQEPALSTYREPDESNHAKLNYNDKSTRE